MFMLGFGMPGGQELLVILFIILLLFGAKKLPELSRSLGKSLGEFKKGQAEGSLPESADEKVEKREIVVEESDDDDEKPA
jgi:sec-independent protein translocase protein TatA